MCECNFKLKNKTGTLEYLGGTLVFERNGNILTLGGGEEFVLYIARKGEEAEALPASAMRLAESGRLQNGFFLRYEQSGLIAEVTYLAKEETFEKRIVLRDKREFFLKRICLESGTSNLPLSEGGEGMPVFLGRSGWCGIEFPAANNRYEGQTCAFLQAPFVRATEFQSLPVVYGLDCRGDVRLTFADYIESKTARDRLPLRIYCDWGLHDDMTDDKRPVELTAKMTLDNLDLIGKVMKETGIGLDYYLMDAFWFEPDSGYRDFKKRTFPDGIAPVLEKLQKMGLKFGLWFDINCKHGKLRGMEKYNAMLDDENVLCFSCDRVADIITEAVAHHITENHIDLIKLDFAYFECKNPAHGHSVELCESKERAVMNFIAMVGKLKALNPDLKILCYNGWTTSLERIGCVRKRSGHPISPYWCEYADYFYCGDPRPSEIASGSLVQSIVYYTDAMVRDFAEGYVPLRCIDDHGTMLGKTETIYRQGRNLFRQGILLNVMRGGCKLNLYGDLSDLGMEDWEYYRFVDGLFREITEKEMKHSFICGDARRGEVYGYSASAAGEGFFVLCNPAMQARRASVTLPTGEGVRVELIRLIEDGCLVPSSQTEECENFWQVELPPNGYLLAKWKIGKQRRSFNKVILTAGDRFTICTEGKSSLALTFTEVCKDKPVRTAYGYPNGLKVIDARKGEPLTSTVTDKIWSGVSWLYFPLTGTEKVTLEYDGTPILLKYETEDRA